MRVALETAENGAAGGSRAHPLAEIRVEGAAGRYQLTYAGNEHVRAEGDLIPTRLLSAPERPDAELLVAALGARGQDPRVGVALRRAAELVA